MLKPSANIVKTPHNSRYSLVIAIAKRAREITTEIENADPPVTVKPVELACRDFVAGKYIIHEPDPFDYEF